MPTNLTLGKRLDKQPRQIHHNSHNTNNPKRLSIIRTVVPEHNGIHNTTQVTERASEAGDNAVGLREDVRDIREISAVPSFHEECHAGNQANKSVFVLGISHTDDNEEGTRDDSEEDLIRTLGIVEQALTSCLNLPAKAS